MKGLTESMLSCAQLTKRSNDIALPSFAVRHRHSVTKLRPVGPI